jgi:hypothetical protein
MTRAKKIVVAVSAAVALGFFQYAWFSVFGPPARWGTGVVDVKPKFVTTSTNVISLEDTVATSPTPATVPEAKWRGSNVVGHALLIDEISPEGPAILQSYGGKNWTADQHLYFRRTATETWREVRLPARFIAENPKLVRMNGRLVALVGRWHSWYPERRNYKRFLRSIVDAELRPEYALYSIDPESGAIQFLFPGQSVALSPDRRFAAYMSSENNSSGFDTIRVLNMDSNESKPVLSLREIDPGSGTSFQYQWMKNSRELLISGGTQGFSRSARGYGDFRIIYLIGRDVLIEIDDPALNRS